MTGGDFVLWLCGALFGAGLMGVVVAHYVRPIFSERVSASAERPTTGTPASVWLYCEEGAPLDQQAAWFRVRAGGTTVLGNTPRAPVGGTSFVYLSAHDVTDRQVTIRWDAGKGRYLLEKGDGIVRHNNEPVAEGA